MEDGLTFSGAGRRRGWRDTENTDRSHQYQSEERILEISGIRVGGSRIFVCILHATIADVSVLCFSSVLRINNLRVFNTCAGSTPAASTTFILNNLIRL